MLGSINTGVVVMRRFGILIVSCLCLVSVGAEPEVSARKPGLVEFMTGYCVAILHVHADESGEVAVDYWKVDESDELARKETLAYLQARRLTGNVTPDVSGIFFLRLISQKERDEIFSFATRIEDEEERAAFKRQKFKYALVKMLLVTDGTLELLEPSAGPRPEEAPVPTKYTLDEFHSLVQGYLEGAPGDTLATPSAYTPGSVTTSAQP